MSSSNNQLLPSSLQVGDKAFFLYKNLPLLVEVLKVKFGAGTVHYDLALPIEGTESSARLYNIHASFVTKEREYLPESGAVRRRLVAFGNYLLSDERKALYEGEDKESRMSEVNHADLENWEESLKNEVGSNW
ncbi:MAG TPA: hypothetical protein VD794_03870 [Flavisolibacter sp.]|nr:hypothetical protein [Flavisolibacter sp.]